MNDTVIAFLLMSVGAFTCFAGSGYMRLALALFGGVLGAITAQLFFANADSTASLVTIVVVAVIFAMIFTALYRYLFLLVGLVLGVAVGLQVAVVGFDFEPNSTFFFLTLFICAIIGGVVGLTMGKVIMRVATAIIGASFMVLGALVFMDRAGFSPDSAAVVQIDPAVSAIALVAMVVLAFIGYRVQSQS